MQRAASRTTNQQHKGQHRWDTMVGQPQGIPSISSATQTNKEPTQERHRKRHNWMHNRQQGCWKGWKKEPTDVNRTLSKVKCDVTM